MAYRYSYAPLYEWDHFYLPSLHSVSLCAPQIFEMTYHKKCEKERVNFTLYACSWLIDGQISESTNYMWLGCLTEEQKQILQILKLFHISNSPV